MRIYQFRIKGQLASDWRAWLGEMSITPGEDGTTTLAGPLADQAALYGALAMLRDLGVELLAVSSVEVSAEPAPPLPAAEGTASP